MFVTAAGIREKRNRELNFKYFNDRMLKTLNQCKLAIYSSIGIDRNDGEMYKCTKYSCTVNITNLNSSIK